MLISPPVCPSQPPMSTSPFAYTQDTWASKRMDTFRYSVVPILEDHLFTDSELSPAYTTVQYPSFTGKAMESRVTTSHAGAGTYILTNPHISMTMLMTMMMTTTFLTRKHGGCSCSFNIINSTS